MAVELLKQGLGWLDERSASRSQFYSQMEAANQSAKDARLGIWEKYDPASEEQQETAATQMAEAVPQRVRVSVQHVEDGNTFWVNVIGDAGQKMLDSRSKAFAQGDFGAPGVGGRFRVGQYCLAPFSDGEIYRAKVRRAD